jgi:hypothetical protein
MRHANYKIYFFFEKHLKKFRRNECVKGWKPQVNEKKNEKLPEMKMKKEKRNERAPLV